MRPSAKGRSTSDPQRLALEGSKLQPQAAAIADGQGLRLRIEHVERLGSRDGAENDHTLIQRLRPEVDCSDLDARVLGQLVHQHQQAVRLNARYIDEPGRV